MPAVSRVLPWKRHVLTTTAAVLEPVLDAYRANYPKGDTEVIEHAYAVADEMHTGQLRKSGEPYINHPVSVALICAELGLDDIALSAALLHDAVEDTRITVDNVKEQFGDDIAAIVDGVTKLDRMQFDSREQQQAATMRKMLVAMAHDWRVLIIKLADRLHNMRTLAVMPRDKQLRIAQETLDVYAPLAHRLGIQDIKWQLEDLAFATVHPKFYAEIEQMVEARAPERDQYLKSVIEDVKGHLAEVKIDADVFGRPKHLWSIYEKMVVGGKEFNEIYDLVGIRVIVDSVKDCYAALGTIHATWKPVQGRFKDYIAMPKFNLYQSLHTTVVGPQGKPLEVQIRTREMHTRAEHGIAAHWGYKEKGESAKEAAWFQNMIDLEQESSDPLEFLETLKLDLEQDEVYVFTPKGRVIALPAGATPIDFAYAIHTEVGHRCIGARVNDRLVPLDSKLTSGDKIDVLTSKVPTAGPSRDWLNIAVSSRAQNKIKQWFSRERREDAIESGREELVRMLRKLNVSLQRVNSSDVLQIVTDENNYGDVDTLYAAIGDGHITARIVANRVAREFSAPESTDYEELPTSTAVAPRRFRQRAESSGVHVEGLDDVMVRLSRCCTPVPGDDIMGFVTRGRGVSVHRADCANAVQLAAEERDRLIDVEWDSGAVGTFVASIEVKSLDRSGLLFDVSRVLSEYHVSIISSSSHATADRASRMRFEFELADPAHLDSILKALKRIDSVYDAYRIVPGRK